GVYFQITKTLLVLNLFGTLVYTHPILYNASCILFAAPLAIAPTFSAEMSMKGSSSLLIGPHILVYPFWGNTLFSNILTVARNLFGAIILFKYLVNAGLN